MQNNNPHLSRTLITNAYLYTGDPNLIIKNGAVLVQAGKIIKVLPHEALLSHDLNVSEQMQIIDLKGRRLAPGLVDIQINGGYTHYFSKSPNEESLLDISNACKDFGTLHFLPTLISSPTEVIITAINAVRTFKQKHPDAGVLGMHLEGPFFNPLKRGAHSPNIVRKPTDKELELIIKEGKDTIKVMTMAPEMFTDDQIRYLQDQGILLSAGHSNMTYEQAHHYFDMGINLITHLYNAMSGFTHRAPGFAGAALERAGVWAPIVLDGHHVHFGAARTAHQMKKEHLLLISDSSFLGRRVQDFVWEDFDAKMIDGTYRNKEGNLAGAAISMVEAMQNALEHLNTSETEVVAMATSRPAHAIRMHNEIGYIAPGYPARFTVFDPGFNQVESLIV